MEKMLRNEILYFKEIYKFSGDFFYGSYIFCLLKKNVFVKIKTSIFLPKYTRYGKNVKKQNSLFQRDLQISW